MDILDGLKKDIEKGIKQGVDAVKSTATLVKEKAGELTEKGKTQYRLFELKNKEQKQFSVLGKKLHQLVAEKKVSISNQDLKKLLSGIDKTRDAIAKLKDKKVATPSKKPAKGKSPAPKKTTRKKVTQKAAPQ